MLKMFSKKIFFSALIVHFLIKFDERLVGISQIFKRMQEYFAAEILKFRNTSTIRKLQI